MKILSFPFSLYSNSGGCRILRQLYKGKETDITSLVVEEYWVPPLKGLVNEKYIYAFPRSKKWMRWRLRYWVIWLRQDFFKPWTVARIHQAAKKIHYDVIHIVQHGPFCAALCYPEFCTGKQLWVSFHDHYSTILTSKDDARILWNKADRRLVISDQLGIEYQKLFGYKTYEIITDGVDEKQIRKPSTIIQSPVIVYFAGMLHFEYLQLFTVLADALDILSKQGFSFKLIMRGTQPVKFLEKRLFQLEYRPVSLDSSELKNELDLAAILYLPIKFTIPDFYLYSLSTKMVGYTGAPGTILYHGPVDSAACKMLKEFNAAVFCNNLNADNLAKAIIALIGNSESISFNAKILASEKFNLSIIQNKFWQVP